MSDFKDRDPVLEETTAGEALRSCLRPDITPYHGSQFMDGLLLAIGSNQEDVSPLMDLIENEELLISGPVLLQVPRSAEGIYAGIRDSGSAGSNDGRNEPNE